MTDHPAKFTNVILDVIRDLLIMEQGFLARPISVFDPFCGTGKIHDLNDPAHGVLTYGVEIEPEWAAMHERTVVGNALDTKIRSGRFDVIATSPCVTPDMRVLTADLRWVPAGDIEVGQRLLAFDEDSPGVKVNGDKFRRKYSWAEVVANDPGRKACARVHLSNGTSVTTTTDHPWLAIRSKGYSTQEWIATENLVPDVTQVLLQVEPWGAPPNSWETGWLAGMFDGEGSMYFGVHGSPKMQICQVAGPVNDAIGRTLLDLGHSINVIPRAPVEGRQPVINTYVNGGWPGMLKAMGQIRPMRLLANFQAGDVSSRTIQPERVTVESVEPIGIQEIAGIETTSGTLIVEGFMHHNTYGNRMADSHNARDSSKRMTYKHRLGRHPSAESSATLHWGPKYWEFHKKAWVEQTRILRPGGLFVLNVKNFHRTKTVKGTKVVEEVDVCQWHLDEFTRLGYRTEAAIIVPVRGMRMGANHAARVNHEMVYALRKFERK